MAVNEVKKNDSGWKDLNYGTKYRRLNGVVFVYCSYNGSIADGTLLGTLPVGYRPESPVRVHNYLNTNEHLIVNIDGTVYKSGNGTSWINAIVSYPLN